MTKFKDIVYTDLIKYFKSEKDLIFTYRDYLIIADNNTRLATENMVKDDKFAITLENKVDAMFKWLDINVQVFYTHFYNNIQALNDMYVSLVNAALESNFFTYFQNIHTSGEDDDMSDLNAEILLDNKES